ncbi:MAG TPA: EAL domain-containing protein [Acetobacteraceae bacterium]|jgi:EAL domain-containing protein (putative c-di-GMP-specific phosphodiesterase class I)
MKPTSHSSDRSPRDGAAAWLPAELACALAHGVFALAFQPLVDLRSGRVSGCEALIRWYHPQRGTISPAAFIPAAEESGRIVAIGEWVPAQACAQARLWPEEVRLAVNLSPVQLASPGLIQAVRDALARAELPPRRLELEITETAPLPDGAKALTALHLLRELGVRSALDDFGTGYASLGYLRCFLFDRIKIDQSFVRDLASGQEPDAGTIPRAIMRLGTELSMGTKAEGIETPAQRDLLARLGCLEGQGFLFSRPRPAAEIPGLIARLTRFCPSPAPPARKMTATRKILAAAMPG